MASDLTRLIEHLQTVDQKSASAQVLVTRLVHAVEEQERRLISTREQLEDAKGDLRRCKATAAAVYSRLTGVPNATPDDPSLGLPELPRGATLTTSMRNEPSQPDLEFDDHDSEPEERIIVAPKAGARPVGRGRPKHQIIHVNFPTVIDIDGVWTELACKHCGANAAIQSGDFIKGVMGFKNHFSRLHSNPDVRTGGTLDNCTKRVISAKDVAKMMAGQNPVDTKIVMKLTPGHGTTTESETDMGAEGSIHDPVKNAPRQSTETLSFQRFLSGLAGKNSTTAGSLNADVGSSHSSFGVGRRRKYGSEPDLQSFSMLQKSQSHQPEKRRRTTALRPCAGPVSYASAGHDEDDEE